MVYTFYKWCVMTVLLATAVMVTAAYAKQHSFSNTIYPHPFYISVTEITHNNTEKILEISCKFFFEDFEQVLTKKNKTPVDLNNPKDKKAVDKMVADYLLQHLKIKVDGKAVMLTVLGYEKEREALWCYLQVDAITSVKKMEVFNDIFYEDYASQINLIHANVGSNKKSTRINNPNPNAVFDF